MIPVSNEYRRQLIAGNRNWLIKVDMTLADGTILNLTNEHIWDNGIVLDNAISSDNTFDLGAAIVGSLKIVVDNIKGTFSTYDFFGANIVLYLGVDGDVDEYDVQRYYRIGFYVVDEPTYNGSLITLNCLDNMTWFDVPFENITLPSSTTAGYVVSQICSHVGVTLGTPTFPNYTTAVSGEIDSKLSCREVIQYIAQMCCCYCKIDTAGELVLAWYDKNAIIGITNYDGGTYNTTTTPYSDGCDLDGGHFNPWDGDSADGGTFQELLDGAWISNNFDINVSTDDVVVTGCRVRNSSSRDDAYDELWVDTTLELTHDRYVLVIENNPFITTNNAAAIANVVGSILAGLPIRGFNATSLSDFSYETGDMATVVDFRGNRYYTWITHFTFTTNNSEKFSCGVESLKKRSEQRFSTSAETIKQANVAISAYDTAVKEMNVLAQNAIGYYKYQYDISGATVTWLHDGATEDLTDPANPLFPNSDVVFKISGDGVFISHDGGANYDSGYDANSGTAILSLIYAVGISCDWIHSGTLTLGNVGNQDGWLQILDGSGNQIGYWNNTGIHATAGSFSGSITGSTITGSTITSEGNAGTSTTISGGSVNIISDGYNYLRITGGGETVTFGPKISVNGDIYYEARPTYFGWALSDAHDAHSSDKKLKKKIKDIPIKNSRELILNARPRYYEFKKSIEGGVRSGFVAQELRESLDKIGDTTAIERESIRREGEREVIYEDFIAHLVNTTQDLYKRVDSLEKELAELKARVK